MRFTNGLRVMSLATIVTLATISVQPASVAAADPSPTPTADPSPTPTADPSPTADPAPTATADPSPTPTPAPTADPTPTADPSPTPDPSADPAPTPTADPTADPSPTPDPSADPTPDPATVVPPVAVVVRPDFAARVARIAKAQRGDRYVRGASGPNRFDCSGLVRFSYNRAGVGRRIGGGHSARAMLRWGRLHGRTSRHHPHIGDVVIYGNGSHAAIYIGNGRVISALNPRQGIRITRLHALSARFTTFIHTRI